MLRAHDALDPWLRRNRLGRLEHRHPPAARAAAVLAEARHGNHQIGTIRMGTDRRAAVVDGDCRAFDAPNLFVVSTAVLPTSGQANPTLSRCSSACASPPGWPARAPEAREAADRGVSACPRADK